MSLGDDIFNEYEARKLPLVPVRAFGRDLFIRHWSAHLRAVWETLVFDTDGKAKATVRHGNSLPATVVISLTDETGKAVFYALTEHDEMVMTFEQIVEQYALAVARVRHLDSVEMEKVFQAATKINVLDKDLVEQAEKNSALALS